MSKNHSKRIPLWLALSLFTAGAGAQCVPSGDMQHMETRPQEKSTNHGVALREPEKPLHQTGTNPPVTDWLAEARKAPPRALAQFEQAALRSNPTLRQAESQVRSSAGLARQAGLWSNPIIGYQSEQIRGGSYGGGEQGGFLQQSIVLGGKLRARRNVYEEQLKGDQIELEARKQNVLGTVRMRFYAALAAQRMVEIRQQLLDLALDTATTAHQLSNVGQADAPDVLQAEVESEQAKLELESAQQSYIGEYRMLTALAGETQGPISFLEGSLEEPPAFEPDKLYQDLLTNSPAIRLAQQQAVQAQAVLTRDKRENIPDLTLRVGEQQNFEKTSSSKPAGAQSFASAGIQLPIFNRNQGNIESAQAETMRAQAELERVRLSIAERAQPLIQQYAVGRLRAERYRTEIIPRAQRAYELYLKKYRGMAAPYSQVLDSQRTLFHLQQDYVQTLAGLWMASEALQNQLMTDGSGATESPAFREMQLNLPAAGPQEAQ